MTEKRTDKRTGITAAVIVLLLFLLLLCNLTLGSVTIPLRDLPELLFGGSGDGTLRRILWELRLPRAIMAFLLGGALALAGLMLQTFFENPIAGPFVLGISSGAKLLVAVMLILSLKGGFTLSSYGMVGAAFAGALLTVLLLMLISGRIPGGASLLVAGIMIGYICSAVTDLLINMAQDENVVSLHNWSLGSFSGTKWDHVAIAAVVIGILFILALFLAKPMQAYLLGETVAASLGVNIRAFRIVLVVTASLLAATVTAFAGPVSFVGIAVPFLVRRLLATEKMKAMIPLTFLGGGVFCLAADLFSRLLLSPTELSVSVVTSIMGAPVVIFMLLHRKDRTE